jgi:hypothetical protein
VEVGCIGYAVVMVAGDRGCGNLAEVVGVEVPLPLIRW